MLLRHLTYFLAVAQHRSFTRAAAALFVSQPALSQQIKQLEESLGAQLFDRNGRSIQLTDAGEVWLRYVQQVMQKLEEGKRALHDVEDLSRGSLRVAVTPTFSAWFIGPVLAAFWQRYPAIRLTISEMSQERIEEQLLEGEQDVGIAFEERHSPEIVMQPLLNETLALVVSRQHPLAASSGAALASLNDALLVLLSTDFATRGQIDRACAEKGLHARVVMEANSITAVLEVIRRTPLATLLPAAIAASHDSLRAISLHPPLLERTAVLMQRKDAWQSSAARAFKTLTLAVAEDLKKSSQ
ncbi:transcriptional regulator CynR [Vagococcus sp. WN89Y]|uniref:transcriptional regulator CynR n=1 Tax=Vagococcus sp. WN89Y TaxID=3457258 RepID=UPI003FCE7A5B